MEDNRKYIPEIIDNLKQMDPYKIILFGSHANETFLEDSDLDLVVVLNSSKISQNYEEKMRNKLKVRGNIYNISKKVPIDLVVYTKAEFDIISKNKTSFYTEIINSGKILYEKAD